METIRIIGGQALGDCGTPFSSVLPELRPKAGIKLDQTWVSRDRSPEQEIGTDVT